MLHKQPETFSYQIINEGSNRLCVLKYKIKYPLHSLTFQSVRSRVGVLHQVPNLLDGTQSRRRDTTYGLIGAIT